MYLGAGSPNAWHSPTQIVAVTLMLLCVPMTADAVEGFRRRLPEDGEKVNIPARNAVLLSVLLTVSLLAKPTFMQAFLPAAGLYFLALWIRKPKNGAFFWRMIAVAAPGAVLMLLQYLYYFQIYSAAQGSGMMVLVTWQKTGDVVLKALLTRAFPWFVLVTCIDRDTWRSPLYRLAFLMDVISILELLLFSETGRRASDGNFGWAMMGSALMLWTLTLPVFLRRLQGWLTRRRDAAQGRPYLEGASPRAEAAKWASGGALLLWHLASGIYYIVYLLTSTNSL